ncbi:GntR family transcriptional regulator [Streptomyces crystallinus]|uniref:HTH gntR-type domain-containing protein n=1 Tax=Streptomyces crystallinus TaxID=68191 RepID=A0ABP3RYW6_9ACTN
MHDAGCGGTVIRRHIAHAGGAHGPDRAGGTTGAPPGQALRIAALAARMRQDIHTGAWPPEHNRVRRDLCDRYQEPERIVAGAVKLLKGERLLDVRPALGARPLPAAGREPARWSCGADMTLVASVEAAIKSRIAAPGFPPDGALDSADLAAEFDVSRSTVTAALRRLREQRLIVGRGSGIRVRGRARGTT